MAAIANNALSGAYKAASLQYASKLMTLEGLPDGYSDEEANKLGEDLTEAETLLIKTPAPDIAAIIDKLQLAWRDGTDAIAEYRADIVQDIIRLAGGIDQPAIGFDARRWIRRWAKAGGGLVVQSDQLVLLAPSGSNGYHLELLKYELDVANGRFAVKTVLSEMYFPEAAE